ncbi:MAG: BadF/BadG/BcrA/BcrD ATPase family protein [Candidatus Izemoplasmatales bacterium]
MNEMSNKNKKQYFLGIDGGGTKTQLVIIDEKGSIVAEGNAGTASIDTISFSDSFKTIQEALKKMQIDIEISGVFAGIGGIASTEHEEAYIEGLRHITWLNQATYIQVKNDVYGALASGNGELQGIALILGTGAVCFGINGEKTWRCGGYHYKEGDAGSAFDVGFQALKYYARVLDGRYLPSSFSDAIRDYLGIDDFIGLVKYFHNLERTKTAKIAPIVTSYARSDQHAYKIVATAADEVRLLVEGVYRQLHFQETDLVVIGGIGTADTIYKELYAQAVLRISPDIHIILPKYTPAYACALIAKEKTIAKQSER